MKVPPTGTITFLFTDIEGSTALWEDDPGAMPSAAPFPPHPTLSKQPSVPSGRYPRGNGARPDR